MYAEIIKLCKELFSVDYLDISDEEGTTTSNTDCKVIKLAEHKKLLKYRGELSFKEQYRLQRVINCFLKDTEIARRTSDKFNFITGEITSLLEKTRESFSHNEVDYEEYFLFLRPHGKYAVFIDGKIIQNEGLDTHTINTSKIRFKKTGSFAFPVKSGELLGFKEDSVEVILATEEIVDKLIKQMLFMKIWWLGKWKSSHEMLETIQVKNKELIAANEAKDMFLANTSHELRTPLNGILGFSSLLQSDPNIKVGSKSAGQVRKIENLAKGLKNQVNMILDIAKSKDDSLVSRNSRIALNDVISDAVLIAEGLQVGRKNRNFAFSTSWGDPVAPTFICDYEKLLTIIRNLISNAFKFGKHDRPNQVEIEISLNNRELCIIVRDTGIGIPVDQQGQVFDDFRQVEMQSNRSYEGTGLGLSLVKRLLNLLGGTISLKSTEGVGSEFIVNIPEQDDLQLTKYSKTEKPLNYSNVIPFEKKLNTKKAKTNISRKILIVDDNPVNCEVIQEVLALNGYNTITALGGREALTAIEENKPDLILLDLMMPEISGEDVIKYCRLAPEHSKIPIIILTARASEEDRIAILNIGADEYLAKPIISDEILIRVRNTILRLDLNTEQIKKSILQSQVDAARKVQQSFLSSKKYFCPGYNIETHYSPAQETGGDWFNIFHDEGNGNLFIALGDVSGHGLPSAMVTALVSGAISAVTSDLKKRPRKMAIAEMLTILNDVTDTTLCSQTGTNRMMTMIFAGINVETGQGILLNAGHTHPCLILGNKAKSVLVRGTPLGLGLDIASNRNFREFQLGIGDKIFFYTDGLIENQGPGGETFRLFKWFRKHRSPEMISSTAYANLLIKDSHKVWEGVSRDDDCTFLLLERL